MTRTRTLALVPGLGRVTSLTLSSTFALRELVHAANDGAGYTGQTTGTPWHLGNEADTGQSWQIATVRPRNTSEKSPAQLRQRHFRETVMNSAEHF
jgi:hypothetical protein